MSKKAIILGGSGFLGSALCAEARKRGWDVIPVNHSGYPQCVGMSCDVLINANGNSKKYLADKDPNLDFDLSVLSVAHSLHDIQTRLYVYLSSIDVYSNKSNPACNHEDSVLSHDKISPYGFNKLVAEQLVRHTAKSWLILRLGGFVGYGLKKNSIYDMLNKQPLRVHPDSCYQYMDAAAMAAIAMQMIDTGPQKGIFNLTGDGIISLKEIARWIPDNPLSGAPLDQPPEHYEVNISKIKMFAEIPATRKIVERFVKDAQAGLIKLS
jgi:nucleoside-diphosphate-sugar epimerase